MLIIEIIVSDMLRRTLTGLTFIFLSILSSINCDGDLVNGIGYDGLSNLIANSKEKCTENQDPLLCDFWYSYELSNFQTPNKQNEESASKIGDQEEILIDIPASTLQKRFSVFRRKNPAARGYKRGPGFRSWGGKRNSDTPLQDVDKRAKFVSWGGKRASDPVLQDVDKKTKFASWGGKRALDSSLLDVDKKAKFVSWGGKRSSDPPLLDADKRAKFVSWGGKRNGEFPLNDDMLSEESVDKRTKFQSWGGKRESPNDLFVDEMDKREPIWKDKYFYLAEPFKKHVPKRPQFQSWGGKRALSPWDRFLTFLHFQPTRFWPNGGEKRKFSSWGGKRYEDDSRRQFFPKNESKTINAKENQEQNPFSVKESTVGDKEMHDRKTDLENDELRFGSNTWDEKEREEYNKR